MSIWGPAATWSDRKTVRVGLGLLLVMALRCESATGQASSPPRRIGSPASGPEYEVVTIKPSRSSEGFDEDSDADSFWARGVTLKMLVAEAYGVRREFVSGIAGPLESARFDVQAKVVDPDVIKTLTDEARPAMLRHVLEERFHLEAHVVTRTLPVYELLLTRGGPKFKETPKEQAHGEDMDVHWRRLEGKDARIASLADALSGQVDRTVVDKTGLSGSYDFALRWSRNAEDAMDVSLPPGIFVAVEDQLGLKLQPAKGPVRTLVVDSAGMPGEN